MQKVLSRMGIRLTLSRREMIAFYLFLVPWFVGFILWTAGPMLASLYLSLTRYSVVASPVWVGLQNYVDVFTKDAMFPRSMVATGTFVLCVPVAVVAGLLIGTLLSNERLKGLRLFRAAVFAPYVTAPVAVAVIFLFVFNPTRVGLLNVGLKLVGLKTVNWFRTGGSAMAVLWLVYVWTRLGFNMIFVITGLQAIQPEYYESAALDGASPFQRFRYITLPLITPTLFFLLVMGFTSAFQEFNLPFLMTGGGPRDSTALVNFYTYKLAFEYTRMGYASAVATVTLVVLVVVTLIQWRLQDRWVFYAE